MSPHGQRHRRHRPLCPSPEPPLRVPAAGRSLRSGPPECVQTRPPVPATPGPTLGASLVTLGGDPRDAPPQTSATVLECAWIPSDGGARRESPGSRRRRVRGVCTNRSRAHRFRKPEWLIKVHAGTEELGSVAPPSSHGRSSQGSQLPAATAARARFVPDAAATAGVQRGATGKPIVTPRRTPRPVIPVQEPFLLRGGSRIRTLEGISRRIYSPLPLAARATRLEAGCTGR
jgi:hypothetical protein